MNAIIEAKKKLLSRKVGAEFCNWWTSDYAMKSALQFEKCTSLLPVADPAYNYYNERRNAWLDIAILIEEIKNTA